MNYQNKKDNTTTVLIVCIVIASVLMLTFMGMYIYKKFFKDTDDDGIPDTTDVTDTAEVVLDLSDYVGDWQSSAHGSERSLTVHTIDADKVEFTLWYPGGEVREATAKFKEDYRAEYKYIDASEKIRGSMEFTLDGISFTIDSTQVDYITADTTLYDRKATTPVYHDEPEDIPGGHSSHTSLYDISTPSFYEDSPYTVYTRVGSSVLNFRTGPGESHSVLKKLKNNYPLVVYGYNHDRSWVYAYDSGSDSYGWCAARYVSG